MIPVPGYDGRYWATQYGEIVGPKGHALHQRKASNGYMLTNVYPTQGSKLKTETIHRLVALAYLPNPLGHTSIDHIDGNKENNTPCNLRWMSVAENVHRNATKGLPIGVTERDGKYRARKMLGGVMHRSLSFNTPEEASDWYNKKVR